MEQAEEQLDRRGFDSVLKELISLHGDARGSDRSKFDKLIRELMADREKAAVAAERASVAADRLKQQEENALFLRTQQEEFQKERQSHQNRLNEMMLKLQKQQEEFQAKIERERREHSMKQDKLLARQDELLSRQDQERKEDRRRENEERKEERRRQDQERQSALQQQERQQIFFREVIQQLQDEVKVLRHNESAHLISGTQIDSLKTTPGKHRTTASSSPYSMTPLSLMMETPNKPFEYSIGGGEVVENFAAGESGSGDETNNYVENDAVDEEEPTSIIKSDQGSVVLSDEDQRAKGLISFEEAFLLNKSGQVGNKVENEKGNKPLPKITKFKSRALRDAREKMKMIGGK